MGACMQSLNLTAGDMEPQVASHACTSGPRSG